MAEEKKTDPEIDRIVGQARQGAGWALDTAYRAASIKGNKAALDAEKNGEPVEAQLLAAFTAVADFFTEMGEAVAAKVAESPQPPREAKENKPQHGGPVAKPPEAGT